MTVWTKQNPGLEEHGCSKLDAHGPHEWEYDPIKRDFIPPVRVWCAGVKAHRDTMIGKQHG